MPRSITLLKCNLNIKVSYHEGRLNTKLFQKLQPIQPKSLRPSILVLYSQPNPIAIYAIHGVSITQLRSFVILIP